MSAYQTHVWIIINTYIYTTSTSSRREGMYCLRGFGRPLNIATSRWLHRALLFEFASPSDVCVVECDMATAGVWTAVSGLPTGIQLKRY
jgi:hypothetical protein